jgi:7-keto-8-aminopelargonate synthetase-like enzyme
MFGSNSYLGLTNHPKVKAYRTARQSQSGQQQEIFGQARRFGEVFEATPVSET